ncbi:hypothetical protein SAMN06265795_11477 [Noviherbaspirillum humi]|uniref:DNA binding domain-containing protein, excisionase family n=1 Tax=Noviherbaspirillum humi TaxID=1688639 RepID=A0A239K0V4_9BURK|nr:hypothetical protein [Noviherbaspirillum humi]SNT11645.1 hypothetical protein SAMN06265795_11477 [Noviherbaspirillum humi]
MALVSISEAAKLVRKNRTTIYRDIEKGRLSKTVSPEGETRIDTSELLRAYGRLHPDDDANPAQDKLAIALLEERNRSLERALALEAELRKVKDQVTNELRQRLADKDNVIRVLESKVLLLEYDKQVASAPPPIPELTPTPASPQPTPAAPAPQAPAPPQAQTHPQPQAQPQPNPPAPFPPAPPASHRRPWWKRLMGRS